MKYFVNNVSNTNPYIKSDINHLTVFIDCMYAYGDIVCIRIIKLGKQDVNSCALVNAGHSS